MGEGGVKNSEKLPTSFMDGPLAQEIKFFFNPAYAVYATKCLNLNRQAALCPKERFFKPFPLLFGVLGIYNFEEFFVNPPCFFLSTAFTRKYRAKLVSIQPRSKLAYLHPFLNVSNQTNKTNI